jgi:tetratricopeptide (TPR) repeat protein
MDHPHIARVLDAGTTATGRPYFVMELVKGVPITKYCDAHRLTPQRRLELFVPVCQAVQHAHQKGIIHRDLKPSNVLIALYDGQPVPKVIDFGVAKATGPKLTDRTLFTEVGQVVGTLEYMSPEQAELNQLDIDTRSDIYSLGVLLYELLTGSTPLERKRLKAAALLEVLRLIREEEPPRPSTRLSTTDEMPSVAANRGLEPKKLSGVVRGELDWIVMKALDKDRNRRYETANGFAMDVQRYLADEPVLACPPSAAYRFRKFARRNKTGLAVAGLILFFIALLGGGGGWVLRDRAAREAAIQVEVNQALKEAEQLQQRSRWTEALAAGRRAEAILAGGAGDEDLRQHVREILADVQMVLNLEEARSWSTEGLFNLEKENDGYERAFREYGIDVDALDVAVAAERIRARAIQRELTAVLDAWSFVRERLENRRKDATRLLEIARQADPDPWRNRLRVAMQQHDRQALLEMADSEEMAAQPVPTVARLGTALMKVGAWKEGVAFHGIIQRRHPDDFWISFNLGYCLTRLQAPQWDEAIRYYTAAVALRPENVMAHDNLGIALAQKGRLDEAIAEFREAIHLKPDYAETHYNLGVALRAKGQVDDAIAKFREAIRHKPDYVEAHYNLGVALQAKGQVDDAIAAYREAIRHKTDFAEAHNNLGLALKAKGQQDDAITAYREAIRHKKDLSEPHANLGDALREEGQLDEAIAAYRESIRLKKDYAAAHKNLGVALQAKGQVDEAIVAYREAVRHKPDYAEAHYNLGLALWAKGQVDEAIAAYREAVRLKPDYAEAHYNLGRALQTKGQVDEAIAAYREAIHLKPDYAEAHCNLGYLLRRQGRFVEALKALRHGHELGSQRPDWRYASAQWVKQCERLVALDDKLPDVLSGKVQPADTAERLALAQLCQEHKKRYAAAARFYTETFAAEPKLSGDQPSDLRYDAACAAALAGCGQGEDAKSLGDKERARLRRQALDWLQADLAAWRRLLEKEPAKAGPAVMQQMQHWQNDADFAGVRGVEALARLPAAERPDWQKLWQEVEELRQRAAAPAGPDKIEKKATPK